jgi:hypothetical protein
MRPDDDIVTHMPNHKFGTIEAPVSNATSAPGAVLQGDFLQKSMIVFTCLELSIYMLNHMRAKILFN